MSFNAKCPACGESGQFPDSVAGKKVRCKCGERFVLSASFVIEDEDEDEAAARDQEAPARLPPLGSSTKPNIALPPLGSSAKPNDSPVVNPLPLPQTPPPLLRPGAPKPEVLIVDEAVDADGAPLSQAFLDACASAVTARGADRQQEQGLRQAISAWANGILHHHYRDLGQKLSFSGAVLAPVYVMSVDTLFEKRKLEARKEPFRRQSLPEAPVNMNEVDPWSIGMQPQVKFAEVRDEKRLEGTNRKATCSPCEGKGKKTCEVCNGHGRFQCGSCRGHGEAPCGGCNGSGRCLSCGGTRWHNCSTCRGSGKTKEYSSGGDYWKTCYSCNGSGRKDCGCGNGMCGSCGGSGRRTCGTCGGQGQVPCSKCHSTGEITCAECQGAGALVHFGVLVRELWAKSETSDLCDPGHQPEGRLLSLATGLATRGSDGLVAVHEGFLGDDVSAIANPVLRAGAQGLRESALVATRKGLCRVAHQRLAIRRCDVWHVAYKLDGDGRMALYGPELLAFDIDSPISRTAKRRQADAEQLLKDGAAEDGFEQVVKSLEMGYDDPAFHALVARALDRLGLLSALVVLAQSLALGLLAVAFVGNGRAICGAVAGGCFALGMWNRPFLNAIISTSKRILVCNMLALAPALAMAGLLGGCSMVASLATGAAGLLVAGGTLFALREDLGRFRQQNGLPDLLRRKRVSLGWCKAIAVSGVTAGVVLTITTLLVARAGERESARQRALAEERLRQEEARQVTEEARRKEMARQEQVRKAASEEAQRKEQKRREEARRAADEEARREELARQERAREEQARQEEARRASEAKEAEKARALESRRKAEARELEGDYAAAVAIYRELLAGATGDDASYFRRKVSDLNTKIEEGRLQPCPACDGGGKCSRCGGKGKSTCPACNGKRRVPGTGLANCPDCGGRGNCVCGACKGSGSGGKCLRCQGKGSITISTGLYEICQTCHGNRVAGCASCKTSGRVPCTTCQGNGNVRQDEPCKGCNGAGTSECPTCGGAGLCPRCRGRGKVIP